jgi:hypothetical protein
MVNPKSRGRSWSVAALLIACGFLARGLGGCSFHAERGDGTGAGGNGGRFSSDARRGGLGGSGPCQGLECQQSTCTQGGCTVPACGGGVVTTVSGQVFDPAGKVPLYNIAVYVPNKPLDPIADGPSCDPCDPATGTSLLSGSPIVVTRTDLDGKFTLGDIAADVPAGTNIPLVIQVGKWQRQVTIPAVTACTNNAVDASLTHLPRTQAEGHIPKIAITTGELDALECFLPKIGVDHSEFTLETEGGRVNFYAGGNGTSSFDTTSVTDPGMTITPVHPWWDSLDNLKKYDIILHSCEGSQGQFSGTTPPLSVKSPAARQALEDFADMGGRVFASHWHVYWFEQGPAAFQSIATFNHRPGLPTDYDATIDQSSVQGQNLATWMVNVGGSTTPGIVHLHQNASMTTVDSVTGGNTSQRWIYAANRTPQAVQYLTATTPIPGGQCGRVVVSDIHVSAGGGTGSDVPNRPFPTGCVTTDLSPQEKVIEYMLFDISSCVSPIVP